MTVLVATHPQFLLHDTGHGHPERPARLTAVMETRSSGRFWIDDHLRSIPDHYHAHARRRPDWTR